MSGLSDLYLSINYTGYVASLSSGGQTDRRTITNGKPWTISLKRFLAAQGTSTFELSILPLRKDSPIYLETATAPEFATEAGRPSVLKGLRWCPNISWKSTRRRAEGRIRSANCSFQRTSLTLPPKSPDPTFVRFALFPQGLIILVCVYPESVAPRAANRVQL